MQAVDITPERLAREVAYARPHIIEMLEMQWKLDRHMFLTRGIKTRPSLEQYYHAIFDEFGEFNHELKKTWCWWKKSQKEVDEDKALEELVDIWHFILSVLVEYDAIPRLKALPMEVIVTGIPNSITVQQAILDTMAHLVVTGWPILVGDDIAEQLLQLMVLFTMVHGFNMDQVFDIYKEKNAKNHERMDGDY